MELFKFLVETSTGRLHCITKRHAGGDHPSKDRTFSKASVLPLRTIQQSVEFLCIIGRPVREWRYGATHSKLGTRWRW